MKVHTVNTNFYTNSTKPLTSRQLFKTPEENNDILDLSFQGLNTPGIVKQRGLLMHITSLPAHRSFCGQFGDVQTSKFIQWLKKAKQTHWIMNPLNALDFTLCPYQADGRFSRNKFIVNLNKLTGKEYGKILKPKELPDDITTPSFTLDMLEKQKNPRFKIAFERFKKLPENTAIKKEYASFLQEQNELWLDGYANYGGLEKMYGKDWTQWPKELQSAPEDAKKEGISLKEKLISILKNKKADFSPEEFDNDIEQYKFEQFLYNKQFDEMVEELDKNGIRLIMDLPIGVSSCGIDVWSKKGIFLLDKNFKPTKVSGCPAEKDYGYTQVWGHALYDYDSPEFWDYHEASLRQLLKKADLRLDHFVGYINRAAIPTTYKTPDGRVINGAHEIFKPVEEGGMGAAFFSNEWLEDVYNKRSPKGENIIELFLRVAKEVGKNPEDTYILEDFGPLAKTKLYKRFLKKFGKNFMSQHVPMSPFAYSGKRKFLEVPKPNIALLTGNHDMPPLREYVDKLMDPKAPKRVKQGFLEFCQNDLNLTEEEMKDKDIVFENVMKWHYTKNAKQVQTTLQDALGIYFRPNIPGFWNGTYDKFLMKTTPEALLSFWSRVFPKDFLTRENQNGVNPGYKSLADKFIQMMKDLYPEKKG